MDWFTSDLHFGHKKLALLRGYPDVDAHDEDIVHRLNKFVKMRDTLYIIGDMSFHKPGITAAILDLLPFKKVLVKGNHDNRTKNAQGAVLAAPVMIELGEFHTYLERKFEVFTPVTVAGGETYGSWGEQQIVMFHFPIMHWKGQDKGSWMLHGHLHGAPSGVPGKILDVGWDNWNGPLSLDSIRQLMATKPLRVNHHKGVGIEWPDLTLPPINLYNAPKGTK